MDEPDVRERISRLEIHIEELAETAEGCQKFIVISKFVVVLGGLIFVALALQAIRFDPVIMIGAITAVIGGLVGYGSNMSTLKQTMAAQNAADALRTELITNIDLRVVE